MAASLFSPVRVLVCAGDLVGRLGLTALLQDDALIAVAGQCAPDDDLSAAFTLYTPDVVLWDMGWSATDTVAALNEVVEQGPPVLAMIADVEDAAAVWAVGPRGLLLRDGSPDALKAALTALAHGLSVFDPTLTDAGVGPRLSNEELLIEPLTAREMDVLQAVAQGLSNKRIAQHLMISEHTVKFHINAILGKLGAQSRTEAVVRATRIGLIRL
ncbi:MAG: response regulator transcription factor [Caldilineaceae bacterium]|nr:response regulator transcription factor [Caldilineaceae bacterium]